VRYAPKRKTPARNHPGMTRGRRSSRS
jgi:hypothetical protein